MINQERKEPAEGVTPILLIPENTVGCYAHDLEGRPWSTFEIMNGSTPCALCGVEIRGGWVRGRLFEEQMHVCSSHVRLQQGEVPLPQKG